MAKREYIQANKLDIGYSYAGQSLKVNGNATLNFMPMKGMTIQAQYFVTTTQYFPQFTTKTIHYCNLGIRQQLPKKPQSPSAIMCGLAAV